MTLVMGLSAVAISTGILFAYLVVIWWLDRYEREPFWMVLLTFAWGAIGGTILGCIISLIMGVSMADVIPEMYAQLYMTVVAAPLAEEFTKGLIFGALIFTPHLDNETDGLIYGAAVGLGFATVENLLYFLAIALADPEAFYFTVVARTLFTALVHTISSALFGYTVGYVRHRELKPRLWALPVVGFILAVAMHGLWNFLATLAESGFLADEQAGEIMGLGIVLVILMSFVMFAITQFSLKREQKIIKKYLAEEAQNDVLPKKHAEIIPSWSQRRRSGWVPAHIPRKEYVEAATLLAFRRYQMDTAAPRFKEGYQEEVDRYREKVRGYWKG